MNLFVGNLPYELTDEELTAAFAAHGSVAKVQIMYDRMNGRPRGFGFVEMPNADEANAAIAAMAGQPFKGRPLTVNEAKPREERAGGGGRGGRRGGGSGRFGQHGPRSEHAPEAGADASP